MRVACLLALLLLAACGEQGESADPPARASVDPTTVVRVPAWARVAPSQVAAAREHGVDVAFENELGMRFVLIPSPEGATGAPFYLQTTEVTNAQFRRFKPSHDSGSYWSKHPAAREHTADDDEQPADRVLWRDATAFAAWVSARDGQHAYRLPTEREWERGCRAGTTTAFWWGDNPADGWRYENAYDRATHALFQYSDKEPWPDDGHRVAAPVGSYPPNPLGLHDMAGNVREWCEDFYYPNHERRPRGSAAAERVMRGEAWFVTPERLRPGARGSFGPETPCDGVGFRLAATAR